MQLRMMPLVKTLLIIVTLLYVGVAVVYPQTFQPQTAEEIEFAETNGFERMPEPPASVVASEFQAIHAMLYAAVRQEQDLPAFLAAPLEGPAILERRPLASGAALPYNHTALRPVDSDNNTVAQEAAPLRVRLAPPTAVPAFPQGGLPRASVSLSPGNNIGRGIWSWRVTCCNITDAPQQIDQGDIESVVNSVAIQTIGFGEAKTSNSLFINRSRPVIAAEVTQGIAGLLTGLIASDVISASGIWGAAAVSVFFVTGKLADHFKAVTPADLSTRFAGTAILTDGLSVTLTPRTNPNHCATWEFFARYSGRQAFARSGIPIY